MTVVFKRLGLLLSQLACFRFLEQVEHLLAVT